jgi:aspartyl/asparaginyl-tRNA synthetase
MELNNVGEKRSKISEISAALDGKEIALRARVHNLRLQGMSFTWLGLKFLGKAVFFELRQQTDTIQALLSISDKVSKLMYKFAGSINPESIILIRGTVQKSPEEIKRTTVKDAEILIAEVNESLVITIAYSPLDLGHLRICPCIAIPNRRCAATGDRRRIGFR